MPGGYFDQAHLMQQRWPQHQSSPQGKSFSRRQLNHLNPPSRLQHPCWSLVQDFQVCLVDGQLSQPAGQSPQACIDRLVMRPAQAFADLVCGYLCHSDLPAAARSQSWADPGVDQMLGFQMPVVAAEV